MTCVLEHAAGLEPTALYGMEEGEKWMAAELKSMRMSMCFRREKEGFWRRFRDKREGFPSFLLSFFRVWTPLSKRIK